MIKMLGDESSLEFLRENDFGRLGCVLESGEPYVVPVNYLFVDGEIHIHSLPGQKTLAVEGNPKVCLQVDEVRERGLDWKSVIVFGEFTKITERNRKTEILYEFYEKFPRFTPVEAKFDNETSIKMVLVFRLDIKRLTGAIETFQEFRNRRCFIGF